MLQRLRAPRLISILPGALLRSVLDACGDAAMLAERDRVTVDSMQVLRLHVLNGTGIGLVPEHEASMLPPTLAALRWDDPALSVTLHLVNNRTLAPSGEDDRAAPLRG